MGYDLKPRKKKLDWFHMGAFSFPILLETVGYLWPCIGNGSKWYCVFGVDARMPKEDEYPALLSNDGFHVTAEEARIMARCARNYVAIQRSLPDDAKGEGIPSVESFDRPAIEKLLANAFAGTTADPWPMKIREDFVDKFEAFASWAEQSEGFEIW